MTGLRILALNWRCLKHPQAGGCEVNLFEQARRWAEGGHQVTVFCADPGRDVAPAQETLDGVEVIRRGGRFTVYAWAALHLLLRGHRYDRILDVANGIPFFAPLFASAPATLLVHHVHAQQWFRELPLPLAVLGRFLERVVVPALYRDRPVIAVSESTRDALVADGFEPAAIRVIYNGVSLPLASSAGERPPGHRIVYVGRLKRYKRLDLLIQAVAALRAELHDVRLDIAGDGDARPELEALVERLGLTDAVTIHGYVDEETRASLLRSAAVFATPSMHEGWGLSVVEANAFGRPAVAYDVPGLRHAIRHGETGLLAADDQAFERALSRLLTDDVLWERLSLQAHRWAATFDWDTTARATLLTLEQSGQPDTPAWPSPRSTPEVALE